MTGVLVLAHGSVGAEAEGSELGLVVGGLATAAVGCLIYTRGLCRVLRHEQGRRRHRRRAVCFYGGVLVTLGVALPPFSEVLEERLSTHMVQHMVFIIVSAPLLAAAAPGQPFLAGLSAGLRHRAVSWVRRWPLTRLLGPHVAWSISIAALWLWHLPVAYDAALESQSVHALEHLSFLATAWLFWWHVATVSSRRLRGPVAMLYVVAAALPGAALGAVLVFADKPLYPVQAAAALAHGSNPLFDQQIGGLVMWVPLDYVYLATAFVLFARWFKRLQRDGKRLPGVRPEEPIAASGQEGSR